MINPWKNYHATQTGIITAIDPENSYLPQFEVTYKNGDTYFGFINDIPNFKKRFKIGQQVTCWMQFSITSDRFRVSKMNRVNK